ncbi:MAG: DUF1080 domain-containing protein [Deferribacteres bacterium]|nr:DUF1080 domain-containing protein [Deferribacteres bacterium]
MEPFAVDIPDNANLVADADGWISLFDGKTLEGWRGYRMHKMPTGWHVTDEGELYFDGKGKGDIVTTHQFADFELALEWKISPGGNSGIFYRVSEDDTATYFTGPEMQVLDNGAHKDGKNPLTSAGSNYALHAPSRDVTRPVGEYNEARIVVQGNHVEQWLNGEKLVAYELHSPGWNELVANSKFSKMSNYGKNRTGHIALQDHGNEVWYRNIRIRLLDAAPGNAK